MDRHPAGRHAGHEALRFVRADGSSHSLTFPELAEQTTRFAGVLRSLGVGRGERVFSLTGRGPALHIAVLGTLDLAALMRAAPAHGEIAATQAEDMALLHFTSGTTGTPRTAGTGSSPNSTSRSGAPPPRRCGC